MAVSAFPLQWPAGWKRTEPSYRSYGRFGTSQRKNGQSWRSRDAITVYVAVVRLREELARMGVRDDDLVLSTNLRLRLDGLPRSDQAQPSDPGAAVYWTDPWTQAPRCMAIDCYTKVEQNIAALAATIEAMRAIERHGGAVVLERAFTGFTALPAPDTARHWRDVLGVSHTVQTEESLKAAYRRAASAAHPDKGGSNERMVEVNAAYAKAVEELGF